MSTAWTIAFVALFAFTGFLGIIVLGILRRTLIALERAEANPHSHEAPAPANLPDSPSFDVVGSAVAPLDGLDWSSLGDTTVVFLEAECEGCQLLAVDVTINKKRIIASRQSLMFVLDSGRGALGKLPPDVTSVLDERRRVADAWDVQSSPVAYYVSSAGFVAAATHPHSLQDVLDLKHQVAASLQTQG